MGVCLFMSSTALSLHSEFYFLTKIYWILCNHVKILFMLSCVSFICSWLFFFKHVPDSTAGNGPSQRRSISGNIQRMSDASVERPLPLCESYRYFPAIFLHGATQTFKPGGLAGEVPENVKEHLRTSVHVWKQLTSFFLTLHSEFPCCWNRQ